MPRIGRLHIPGGCYHVMGRGLERRRVLATETDKQDFIDRLRRGLEETQTQCLAWALMPNHYHLCLRVGSTPLAELMRKLAGGYATAYNRRNRRAGYVFQNRYQSILCDEESYLLTLARYIHLNPLKAKVVPDLNALDRYDWTGHGVLMGRHTNDWQQTGPVFSRFGDHPGMARRRYRQFVKDGLNEQGNFEMDGGGLIRSYGGWTDIVHRRKTHELIVGDERILGDSAFVARALKQDQITMDRDIRLARLGWDLEKLIEAVCGYFKIAPAAIVSKGRNNALSKAKVVVCYIGVRVLRLSSNALATRLEMSQPAVSASIKKGQIYCEEHRLVIDDL